MVRGPNRTRFLPKRCGYDLDHMAQWPPFESIQVFTERIKQRRACLSYTATDDHDLGIKSIDERRDRSREVMDPRVRHEVFSELVVEWRALTVALMDPLVALVGTKLGLASAFSMPQMLQGGTWSAGRKIAQALRPPDGPPPILIAADGTVF